MLPIILMLAGCSEYTIADRLEPPPTPPDAADPGDGVVDETPAPDDAAPPRDDPPLEPDPPVVDTAPLPPPDCDHDPRGEIVEEVWFPARSDCAWGVDGNLQRRNEFNQARAVDRHEIRLPEGATLCALSLGSVTADLRFDDHFLLALDGWVLVGGGSGFGRGALQEVDGLYRFDWDRLKGTPFAGRYDPYWCLGEPASTCTVPPTEQRGRLDLDIRGDAMTRLTEELVRRADLPLELMVFGDDDDGDCSHSDVRLQVTVAYVGAC